MTDRVERDLLLPVDPSEVWDALTDERLLETWLADEVSVELRPGGEASFRSGETVRSGWVEEVTPRRRLAFWWGDGDQPASRVELTIERIDGYGTRVRVVETRPLELLDLVGTPLPGLGGASYGPALVAA